MTGRRRAREPIVKEEPKSPANGASKKRKFYSPTDAKPIGNIDPVNIDFNPPPPVIKRQKVAAKSTGRIRFDGVAVDKPSPATRATRRSTRATKANPKKELFEKLGRELRALGQTCEEIAEAFD
jgi:hypothetical protein